MKHMSLIDGKAVVGTLSTAGAASTSWIATVEPYVTVITTVVVGGLTAWYTIERALKLRRERKERK
jgi:hypothetical protein